MEEEKLYGCSIAQSIINKNQNRGNLGTSFSGCLVSIDDLKECIKRGCAFSYVFKNNHRLASNFDGTQILAADIDGGITIEDALNHPLVSQSASFIYTTVNHQPDDPHFRVVFALDKGIFDKDELRQVAKALAIRLSGDRRVIDPGRVFYGSTDCEIFHVGKELSEETVRELSAQGKELLESAKHSTNGDHGTFRSSIPLENDLIVVLPNRQSVPLYSIQRNTSIFCPDHNDVHPSAFVGFSDKGGCFIHCRKCQTTRWLKGSDTPYDFNDFDKSVKKIASEDDYETTRVRGFAFYYQEKRKVGGRIHLSHEEKFKIKELQEGITFVKSPKGSGKTTMLPEIFRDKAFNIKGGTLSFEELEENEDPEGEPLYQSEATNFSILLIGHRQSLIRELCKRIGLNCYLDDYEGKAGTSFHEQRRFSEPFRIDQRQKRYGVCLDSLPILRRDQYDLIIIDESEQVLSHFLSDTMKNKRYHVFDLFRKHLQRAKYVVCLDADLGWVTFNTVCELADAESFDECVRKEGIKDKKSKKSIASRPVNIYLNEFKKQGDEIKLYANKNQLDAEIEDDVKNGKKIFVASNSKDRVILLHKHLKKEFPDKKFLCVTSDNSKSPDVQSVIVDLKKKIPTYDAVLASPSLSTGVDITFANEEKLIDVVYGLFEQRITDHFEMDQQIHRVRHPKEVKVWISPQKFYFETDVAVLSVADQSNILSANKTFSIHWC
jgi:DNA polymerase IIIc chi subunit